MLTIVYVGNFLPHLQAAYDSGQSKEKPFSTECHVAATLEELGHKVIRLQEDIASVNDVVDACWDVDMLLWTRTPGYLRGDGHEMQRRVKELGIPTVTYHLDLFVGISREKDIPNDPFWKSSYCFSPDGDPDSAEKFKQYGVNHFYLKPGVYKPDAYMAQPNRQKYPYDVIFVGSRSYHIEYPFRGELISWLEKTYGNRFMRYPMDGQGHIRGHELNTLYASAKIAVGDSLVKNFNHTHYWSDRAVECPGRGGFSLFPYIEGLYDEFEEGNTIATYKLGDFDDLKFKIDYFLEAESDREDIRLASHQFVKEHCTYNNRMEEMLNTIAEYEPNIKERL